MYVYTHTHTYICVCVCVCITLILYQHTTIACVLRPQTLNPNSSFPEPYSSKLN